jgi:hypothetical protein
LRLSKLLKFYKKSAIFQALLCPTLPSKRPPEPVGERPCEVVGVRDLLAGLLEQLVARVAEAVQNFWFARGKRSFG